MEERPGLNGNDSSAGDCGGIGCDAENGLDGGKTPLRQLASDTEDMDGSGAPQGEMPERDPVLWKSARVISMVFNPLIMPVYVVALLMYSNTIMVYMPHRTRLFFVLVVLLNTFVVPALCVGLLRSLGYIKDLSLSRRRDRFVPLIITALCYGVCAFMVSGITTAFFLNAFLLAGGVCILFSFIVTLFWKISVHMMAAGAALGMLLVVQTSGLGQLMGAIIAMIALSGIIASSRLYLGAHTIAQVGAGFAGGLLISVAIILLR